VSDCISARNSVIQSKPCLIVTRQLKHTTKISNTENEINSRVQQFKRKHHLRAFKPWNVSTRSGVYGTQTESIVLEGKNKAWEEKGIFWSLFLGGLYSRRRWNLSLSNVYWKSAKYFCGAFQVKASFLKECTANINISLHFFFHIKLNNVSSVKVYKHTKFKSENKNAFMASMNLSYRIAHEVEKYRIGENMWSPLQLIWLHIWRIRKLPGNFSWCTYPTTRFTEDLDIVESMYWMN
jgi:hypothetical protein